MKKYILIICLLFTLSINVNAQDIYGTARNKDSLYLDPNDFTTGQVIAVDTVDGQKVFVGKDSVTGANDARVDYHFLRAKFSQSQSVLSGKLRIAPAAGSLVRSSFINVADSVVTPTVRLSTGVYEIQFKTNSANNFAAKITGDIGYWTAFERRVYPLYGHMVYDSLLEEDVWTNELYGYLVFPSLPDPSDFGFLTGKLIARTFDTNWVPKDDMLKDGFTVELKVFIKP